MPSDDHLCPSPGCGLMVLRRQLACLKHWFQLPKDLRDRINIAYKDHDKARHNEALREAFSFYRAGASSALD